MADHVVPHFHNDPGVPVIEIGAKEFMCVGATPPFDHPHVFLDMGDERKSSARIARRCIARSGARSACRAARGMRLAARRRLTARRRAVAPARHVIIAGAGIGGLDRGAGARARRLSRRPSSNRPRQLEETGAGIQLSPNATRILIALGLGERLAPTRSRRRRSA